MQRSQRSQAASSQDRGLSLVARHASLWSNDIDNNIAQNDGGQWSLYDNIKACESVDYEDVGDDISDDDDDSFCQMRNIW